MVLDTNVWLDWLVFEDPRAGPIRLAAERGDCRIIACPLARAELANVLQLSKFSNRSIDVDACLARFDAITTLLDDAPRCALISRDRDDQLFIDLAAHHRAHYLLTRDKALLALARRAEAQYQVLVRVPDALLG